jgi:hypothetical protein
LSPWLRLAQPTVWQAYRLLFPGLTTKIVNKSKDWGLSSNFDKFDHISNQSLPDRQFIDYIIFGIENFNKSISTTYVSENDENRKHYIKNHQTKFHARYRMEIQQFAASEIHRILCRMKTEKLSGNGVLEQIFGTYFQMFDRGFLA